MTDVSCYEEYIYDPTSTTYPGPAIPLPPPKKPNFFHYSPLTGFFMCVKSMDCYAMDVESDAPFQWELVTEKSPYNLELSFYLGYGELMWITGGFHGR